MKLNQREEIKMDKRKVIVDCDPGIDDALAIILALKSKEIEVIGITTVSGNVKSLQGAKNALKVPWHSRKSI